MVELRRAVPDEALLGEIRAALHGTTTLALLHPLASAKDEQLLRRELDHLQLDATTMTLLSTSGSTGAPKRVELSRAAWLAHAAAANAHLGLRADDRWLVTLPLAHPGGLSIVVRCHVAGASVVQGEVPKLGAPFAAFIRTRLDAGITRLSLVPAQLQALLEVDVAPRGVRSVLMGGQSMPPALTTRAIERGWPIVTSYGMTETCGMCVASAIGAPASSIVGRPLEGTELRIDGTLQLRSPAQATRVHGAEPFTPDGWLRTEDRARVEPDGLVLLGRADDVIVSSGHKIDPLELEAALAALSNVRAVSVAGIPHETHGATVAALVVAEGELDLSAIAPYKRPRIIVRVDALPLLPSGKVDRAAVRGLLVSSART